MRNGKRRGGFEENLNIDTDMQCLIKWNSQQILAGTTEKAITRARRERAMNKMRKMSEGSVVVTKLWRARGKNEKDNEEFDM